MDLITPQLDKHLQKLILKEFNKIYKPLRKYRVWPIMEFSKKPMESFHSMGDRDWVSGKCGYRILGYEFKSKGIVLQINKETVSVKLVEYKAVFDFTKAMFDSNKDLLVYGQPVFYEVWQGSAGSSYRRFTKRIDTEENPYKKDVLALLNQIVIE